MKLPPFEKLLEAHGADLHRYLIAGVGRAEADDCFQEVMIAALRSYPSLRDGANLRGWLFTIAYSKAIDSHRRRARRPAPTPTDEPAVSPSSRTSRSGTGTTHAASADCEGPDDALWSAVRRLPPKQRAAILHRYLHDLSYREIGTIIGCSEAAARQNVRAALASLREEIT